MLVETQKKKVKKTKDNLIYLSQSLKNEGVCTLDRFSLIKTNSGVIRRRVNTVI